MSYGIEWIPGGALLGTMLVLLMVPALAVIAVLTVALAALWGLVALAAAALGRLPSGSARRGTVDGSSLGGFHSG